MSTTTTSIDSPAASCPHLPVLVVKDSYYGVTNPAGRSSDFLAARHQIPGVVIRSDVGFSVEIVRHDGIVVLARAGGFVGLGGFANVADFGDLAGDGRRYLMVSVSDRPTADAAARGENETFDALYFVPIDIPVGRHDPRDVGVRLPWLDHFVAPIPIGDQNGDGADDIAAPSPHGGIGDNLYSGRDLIRTKRLPEPFRALRRPIAGLLQLRSVGPPTLVDSANTNEGVELRVLEPSPIRLIAPNMTALVVAGLGAPELSGWIVKSRRIVQLTTATRSGTSYWRWDLDNPCGH